MMRVRDLPVGVVVELDVVGVSAIGVVETRGLRNGTQPDSFFVRVSLVRPDARIYVRDVRIGERAAHVEPELEAQRRVSNDYPIK